MQARYQATLQPETKREGEEASRPDPKQGLFRRAMPRLLLEVGTRIFGFASAVRAAVFPRVAAHRGGV